MKSKHTVFKSVKTRSQAIQILRDIGIRKSDANFFIRERSENGDLRFEVNTKSATNYAMSIDK